MLKFIVDEDMPRSTLQRPPINGIDGIETDVSWTGVAQLGNALWPPHEGDVLLDVAVSITDIDTVNKLMAAPEEWLFAISPLASRLTLHHGCRHVEIAKEETVTLGGCDMGIF